MNAKKVNNTKPKIILKSKCLAEKKKSKQNPFQESEARDILYTRLVRDTLKDNRSLKGFKWVFVSVICLVFLSICIFSILTIFRLSDKENFTYEHLGLALSGFGSILASIIVLPKIIAKHLFPEDSEKVRFQFIKDTQSFDIQGSKRKENGNGTTYLINDPDNM